VHSIFLSKWKHGSFYTIITILERKRRNISIFIWALQFLLFNSLPSETKKKKFFWIGEKIPSQKRLNVNSIPRWMCRRRWIFTRISYRVCQRFRPKVARLFCSRAKFKNWEVQRAAKKWLNKYWLAFLFKSWCFHSKLGLGTNKYIIQICWKGRKNLWRAACGPLASVWPRLV
jgi:hypothetical protein